LTGAGEVEGYLAKRVNIGIQRVIVALVPQRKVVVGRLIEPQPVLAIPEIADLIAPAGIGSRMPRASSVRPEQSNRHIGHPDLASVLEAVVIGVMPDEIAQAVGGGWRRGRIIVVCLYSAVGGGEVRSRKGLSSQMHSVCKGQATRLPILTPHGGTTVRIVAIIPETHTIAVALNMLDVTDPDVAVIAPKSGLKYILASRYCGRRDGGGRRC